MKKTLIKLVLAFIYTTGTTQDLSFIVQINNELVLDEIQSAHLIFINKNNSEDKIPVSIYPGRMIISNPVWELINSENTHKIVLKFDQYFYKGKRTYQRDYEIEMEKHLFKKPWLILDVYDFHDRRYRKRYQCHTEKGYLSNFMFPGSGVYVDCK